jgi:DNA mismatch repair protein MutS2
MRTLVQDGPAEAPVPTVASRATLEALEYPALVALVAAETRTDLGAARLAALLPTSDAEELEARRARHAEARRLALDGGLVPSLGEPFAPLVARLGSSPASSLPPLDGAEIVLVARLVASAAEAARRIETAEPPCPALARELDGLGDAAPLLAQIARVLDAKGRVRDDASPRLVELSRETKRARERVYARLETTRAAHADHFEEESTPLRGGRVLLMLTAGARGRLPGLVHGRSQSGKSFYFEPLDAVEENNALESASEAQEDERQRLLQSLRAELARELPTVSRLFELAAQLDSLEAAARFGEAAGARLAGVAPAGRVRLVAARHPLLDPRLALLRERVLGAAGHTGAIEPLALELGGESGRRVLVVTGPNAGGKTVALKTLGLLALAHQAGLPVPCEAGTELAVFGAVVATVGDEQDLLAERSTFSGRLSRLAEAWREAAPESLALLDELGSGTDPEEGAALAVALVERLLDAGGLALVTTHLTPVALAALERDGAACAAMEFDGASGRPTYRLRSGPPGGSEAIALARRMLLPADWIARAEALVSPATRELRRTLAELEATRAELALKSAEAESAAEASERERQRYERERATLEAERRVVGRKLEGELRAFRERVAAGLAKEEARLREEFAGGRRRGVAAEAAARLFAEAPTLAPAREPEEGGAIEPGARVKHRALGWSGTVEKVDGEKVTIVAAGKRLTAKLGDLVALAALERAPAAKPKRAEASEPDVPLELMLLGFTVEDALDAVDEFLDRALRSSRRVVRLVHGHGTGRLREAIRAHLKKHPAVASARPGAPNEGGNGATVVELD